MRTSSIVPHDVEPNTYLMLGDFGDQGVGLPADFDMDQPRAKPGLQGDQELACPTQWTHRGLIKRAKGHRFGIVQLNQHLTSGQLPSALGLVHSTPSLAQKALTFRCEFIEFIVAVGRPCPALDLFEPISP
jgi:hypothetical protein